MTMKSFFTTASLLFTAFLISGCAETQLAADWFKDITGVDRSYRSQRVADIARTPNNIGAYKVGRPYKVDGIWYTPKEDFNYDETGIASWYGPNFHGKMTANGEIFDMEELTAAHPTLQIPSLVRVTNLENGKSLVVRVNDRGPFKRGRVIDMSKRSAELLGFAADGTARVRVQILPNESRQLAVAAKAGKPTDLITVAQRQQLRDIERAEIDSAAEVATFQERQELRGPRDVRSSELSDTTLSDTDSYAQARIESEDPTRDTPVPLASEEDRLAYQQARVQTEAQFESQKSTAIAGHNKDGRFLPEPVVDQLPVQPNNIYVQVGSFTNPDNAQNLLRRLSHIGNIGIYPAEISGRQFNRVRVGPLHEVEAADRVLDKVLDAGYTTAHIVIDE